MKKILVAVDLQNDFITGALGTPEACAIVPAAAETIRAFDGDELFVTFDTHYDNYLQTLEGQKLPVPHCIAGTPGHALSPEILASLRGKTFRRIIKPGFGTFEIVRILRTLYPGETFEITLIGLCTDICVLTNALILRAAFPEARISVRPSCCAGVTPAAHTAALTALQSCQIDLV